MLLLLFTFPGPSRRPPPPLMPATLQTLGQLRLRAPEGDLEGDTRPLRLLAYLAACGRSPVSRREVAVLLWPEGGRRAKASLRTALHTLRATLGPDAILTEGDGLRLADGWLEVDVDPLDEALDRGDIDRALELYRGPFLDVVDGAGLEFAEWIDQTRSRIENDLDLALGPAVARALDEERCTDVLRWCERWAEVRPWQEAPSRAAASAHVMCGEPRAALAEFERYRLRAATFDDHPSAEFEAWAAEQRARLQPDPMTPGLADAPPASVEPQPSAAMNATPVADGPRSRRWSGAWAFRILLPTAVLALALAWAGPFRGELGSNEGAATARPGTVLARVEEGTWTLSIDDPIETRVLHESPGALPSPDGRFTAWRSASTSGVDTWIAPSSGRTGDTIVITEPADEFPLTWSPDSRFLGVSSTTVEDGTAYQALRILGLPDGREVGRIDWGPTTLLIDARWSPDGTRVLVHHPSEPSRVYTVSGEDLGVVPDSSRLGAWAPGSERIAVRAGGPRSNRVWILDATRGTLRAEFTSQLPVDDLLWLDADHLITLGQWDGQRYAEVLSADGGRSRLIPTALPLNTWFDRADWFGGGSTEPPSGARALLDRVESGWPTVDRLEVRLPTGSLGVGQNFVAGARAIGADGQSTRLPPVRLNWAADGRVVTVEENGGVTLLREGEGWIEVSLGGWAATRTRVRVLGHTRRDAPLLFDENWSNPEIPGWRRAGRPESYVESEGMPNGENALWSNGDENYSSGVVSESAWPIGTEGLSLEVDAHLPLDGSLHQEWLAGWVPTSWDSLQTPTSVHAGLGAVYILAAHAVPLLGNTFWDLNRLSPCRIVCTFTLQIEPGGRARVLIDGRTLALSQESLFAPEEEVRIVLGGRTIGGTALTGRVRAYRGPLYSLGGGP